jgi:uncharacterized protein (DUF2147 family)
MNHIATLLLLFAWSLVSINSIAQTTVIGKWKSIDDKTGEAKSIVEIFEKGSVIHGKIIEVFPKGNIIDPICIKCPKDDIRYNKKILGMEIIKDLKPKGAEFSGGEILDPEVGKVYSCKLWIEGDQLKVRGYLGPFFRTQTWERVPLQSTRLKKNEL